MKKILNPLFQFSAVLFPFALVLYMILFLLENVFSGFVNNVFDLNYFLVPVLFFGFMAAFANKEEDKNENKPTKWDFMLIAGLAALSFVILEYKTADLGLAGFFISIISSILIALISLTIIFPLESLDLETENKIERKINYRKFFLSFLGLFLTKLASIVALVFPKTEKAPEEVIETSKRKLNIPRFKIPEFNYRKFLPSPAVFSLMGLVSIIIIGGLVFSLYRGKIAEEKAIKNQLAINIIEQPSVQIPNDQLLENTPIFVENGSGKTGKAASMAALLSDFNFGNVKIGDADNSDYKNAYLEFNEKDFQVASYVTFLLTDNDKYKVVNMLPPANSSQSGIILILGE